MTAATKIMLLEKDSPYSLRLGYASKKLRTPINLTGFQARLTFKDRDGGVLKVLNPALGGVSGMINLLIPPEVTNELVGVARTYNLTLIPPTQVPFRILEGTVMVVRN